jgi:hypothetical protein
MLALDEEVDFLEYHSYLRTQSDADLRDIVSHLDFVHCPRRAEAANRELNRRRVADGERYSDLESLWRKSLMVFITVVVLTLLLGLTMSSDEARAPQPPPSLDVYVTGDILQIGGGDFTAPNELTVSVTWVYVAQIGENYLRSGVLLFSKSGGYLLMIGISGHGLFKSLREKRKTPLHLEVRGLLIIAVFGQLLLVVTAAWNNIPLLVNGGHTVDGGFLARAVTLLAPWG